MTSTKQGSWRRLGWAGALGVATVLGLSLGLEGSEAAVSPDIVRHMPSADFDSLEGFSGLDGALAMVYGTVGSLEGPKVKLRDDGFVDYDHDTFGYPSVVLRDVEFAENLERARGYEGATAKLEAMVRESATISLHFSNGFLEEGRRYAFFVGFWNPGEFSFLYAHDLDADQPVPGFANKFTAALATKLRAADKSGGPLLATLAAFSRDLNREARGLGRSDLVAAVVGPIPSPPPVRPNADRVYPQFQEETLPGEMEELIPLELVIYLGKPIDDEFALVGAKELGWFAVNHLGYTVIRGYVMPSERFSLMHRPSGMVSASEVSLSAFGLDASTLNLEELQQSEDGIYAILDLSPNADALPEGDVVRSYGSLETFIDELDRLQYLFDGTVEGPEPGDTKPSHD